jgi:COP9 signalosome complex subunit 2
VTRNTSEKSINSILDYVSAAQDMLFMEKVYSITLDNLEEQKNDRLWTKTNLKLAKVNLSFTHVLLVMA